MTVENDSPQYLNTLLSTLAHRRRRLVVDCLAEHRHSTLADLAEVVAEAESSARLCDLSAEYVRDVYLSLYHRHLPKLEEACLAQYDQDKDTVAATEELDDALRIARETIADLGDE